MFKIIFLSLLVTGTPSVVSELSVDAIPPEVCSEYPCQDLGIYSEAPDALVPQLPIVESSGDPVPAVGDLLVIGGNSIGAIKDAVAVGSVVKIATAVSVVLFFLIGILRKFGPAFIGGNQIRVMTVVAGAVAAGMGYVAAGLPLDQVFQLFMAGPGALAINEMAKYFRKPLLAV